MKRSIISAAVFSAVFMSTGAFAAGTETGQLTITGKVTGAPCTFETDGDSVSINMPTVPTSVFSGLPIYSTYNDAVGVTSDVLKIRCNGDTPGLKLSLISGGKIIGNDKAVKSGNDTVGYYLYLGTETKELDVSKPLDISSYKTSEGNYSIPFSAKYLKLTSNDVDAGDVISNLVLRVSED
ncbi:fimbrial family protein [Shigella flexneri 1235-66]|nr:fimbrial family protein [Shigella flexneri 1235-66]